MICWHCNTELIWGGDNECEWVEDYSIVTNLSCPKCNSYVEVYYPRENESPELATSQQEGTEEDSQTSSTS